MAADESRLDELKAQVESEVKQVMIDSDINGVILKTDALGSLEALVEMLKARSIPIKRADIGSVTRGDIVEASAVRMNDKYRGVVLAFSVKVLPDAEQEARDSSVNVFSDQIIYSLIDNYLEWMNKEKDSEQKNELQALTPLCKFQFLKGGYTFRRNDPAVFGIEVLAGRLRQKSSVMNSEGKTIGTIHQLQEEGKTIAEATKGMQIAVSMNGPTIGRQVNEGDILYTLPADHEVKILNQKFLEILSDDDRQLLKQIIDTRRKNTPLYGY